MKGEIREILDAAMSAYEAAKATKIQADGAFRGASIAKINAQHVLTAVENELDAAVKAFKEASW